MQHKQGPAQLPSLPGATGADQGRETGGGGPRLPLTLFPPQQDLQISTQGESALPAPLTAATRLPPHEAVRALPQGLTPRHHS